MTTTFLSAAAVSAMLVLTSCGSSAADEASPDSSIATSSSGPTEPETVVLIGGSGRDALIRGRLMTVGNCAGIEDRVAFWPTGTVVVEESPLVLRIPGHGVVREGDQLAGNGGILDSRTDGMPEDIPKSCGPTLDVIMFGTDNAL